MDVNQILNTDTYKLGHGEQLRPETDRIASYIEARGGGKETLVAGLQIFLQEYLSKPITATDILEAREISNGTGVPFNERGWQHILDAHGGYLPLKIRAVPEGSVIPTSNVLVTMENTCGGCPWLTNFVETALLRAVWYPTTVATNSYILKKLIYKYLEKTCDNPKDEILYKLHDFGARGSTCFEQAGIGGFAHLINFKGTDTLTGIMFARKYYNEPMAGGGINASEHSTITSWGRRNEEAAYRNMIKQYGKPGATFACVSDSYDIDYAVNELWGKKLKQEVIDSGARVIIRPDSGIPAKVAPKVIRDLIKSFGSTTNSKGYKVLPNCVRVIQGDGVSYESIEEILTILEEEKISTENIAFGMGGALLQKLDRDTYQFAMKCSATRRVEDGVLDWHDVYKDPVGDADMSFKKASKPGRLTLLHMIQEDDYKTVKLPLPHHPYRVGPKKEWAFEDVMRTVYENGKLENLVTLEDIRLRSDEHFYKQEKDGEDVIK